MSEDIRHKLQVCPFCDGDGWVQDHHPSCSHEHGCTGHCPIQAQCERCEATGIMWKKDVIEYDKKVELEIEEMNDDLPF